MHPLLTSIRCIFLYPIFNIAVLFVFSGQCFATNSAARSIQPVDLELEYFQINEEKYLNVSLAGQGNNRQTPLEEILVNLFLNEISPAQKLGSVTTDENGQGRITLGETFEAMADTLYEYTFIAVSGSDDRHMKAESELTIRKSDLSIGHFVDNDRKYVKATLTEATDTNAMIPVEGEELLFEVERLLGLLPVADFTFTDGQGTVETVFPDDIPGDKEGNIVIVVRVDEHPDYGNVEFRETVAWGVPLTMVSGVEEGNTRISNIPPPFLSIFYWGGLFAVWGTICYGIFYVFKINNSTTNT